ncbi:MAG: TlpA disulfide reductase family protein [Pirellulales bacterium]
MSVIQRTWKLVVATGIVGVISFAAAAVAEDDKPAAKQADAKAAADEKATDEETDPFALPKDASADELVKFMQKVQSTRPRSQAELEARSAAIREAAAKVKELEKDNKKSENYLKAQFFSLVSRLPELRSGSDEDIKAIIGEAAEMLSSKEPEDFDGNDAAIARAIAQQLEFGDKPDLAKEALTAFSGIFGKAAEKNEDLKPVVEAFAGTLRRMNLMGNDIEIEGKTVGGKDFDWKAYSKGKVVLVDFWATWCGPCIGELPNVKANYEKYHDKGFDVVGISLDENREKLEAFLEKEGTKWTQLFEEGAGWKHPVAVHYGIQGIPTVILVDQQGKVVSLNARGPELGRLLEKLLGPVEDKAADDKAADEKDSDAKASPEKKPATK